MFNEKLILIKMHIYDDTNASESLKVKERHVSHIPTEYIVSEEERYEVFQTVYHFGVMGSSDYVELKVLRISDE